MDRPIFQKILPGILFAWLPLAFFTRAADGFTLTKELVGLGVSVFFCAFALVNGRWVFRSFLAQVLLSFTLWMAGDSLVAGLVKVEVLKGSIHILLIAGTFYTVLYVCGRGYPYEKMIHFALLAGFLTSLHGLVQTFGVEGIDWNNRFESRAFATLGNPNYLGGYLAALIPLAFLLTLQAQGRQLWLGFRGISLALVACLLVTRVRGSYLALAGALLVVLLAFFLPWGRGLFRQNRNYIVAVFVGLAMAGGVYLQRHGGLQLFNPSQVSVQQRVETYRVAWEIMKDHPWLGIGLGQLGIQYPLYQYRPFKPSEYPQHPYTYTEHVHNEFLQFWVEGGLPGLLLFLTLLAAFCFALWQFWKNPESKLKDKELLIGITGGMTALLIQSLSNFPLQVAPTAALFGLFLAAPLALKPPISTPPVVLTTAQKVFVSLAVLAVLLPGIRAVASSVAYRDTVGETSLNQFQNAVYYGKKLTHLSPWNYKAYYAYGKALEGVRQTSDAMLQYSKSIESNPNYVEGMTVLGNLQLLTGHFEEGVTILAKAEGITPNYAMPIWYRAAGLYQLKRYEEAAQEYEKYLALTPNNEIAYSNLGVCYIQLHHKTEAVAAWKKAYGLNPNDSEVIQFLKANGQKVP